MSFGFPIARPIVDEFTGHARDAMNKAVVHLNEASLHDLEAGGVRWNNAAAGEQSCYFDGTAFVSTPDTSDMSLTGSNHVFTVYGVELFDYTAGTAQTLVSQYLEAGDLRGWSLFISATGELGLLTSLDGIVPITNSNASYTFVDGTTYDFQFELNTVTGGITYRVALAGETLADVGTGTQTAGLLFNSTADLTIGASNGGANLLNGYIQRITIEETNGVVIGTGFSADNEYFSPSASIPNATDWTKYGNVIVTDNGDGTTTYNDVDGKAGLYNAYHVEESNVISPYTDYELKATLSAGTAVKTSFTLLLYTPQNYSPEFHIDWAAPMSPTYVHASLQGVSANAVDLGDGVYEYTFKFTTKNSTGIQLDFYAASSDTGVGGTVVLHGGLSLIPNADIYGDQIRQVTSWDARDQDDFGSSTFLSRGVEVIPDPNFNQWDDPTVPNNWTKSGSHWPASSGEIANYFEQHADGIRLVGNTSGSYIGIQINGPTAGFDYEYTIDVASVSNAGIEVYIGGPNIIPIGSAGTYTGTVEAVQGYIEIRGAASGEAGIDGVIRSISVKPIQIYTSTGAVYGGKYDLAKVLGTGASLKRHDSGTLLLDGAVGSHATTPDSVANSVDGDFTMYACAAPIAWNDPYQYFLSKYVSGTRSFYFGLATSGTLHVALSADGVTSYYESSGYSVLTNGIPEASLTNGEFGWVRASVDLTASPSTVTFYTSTDSRYTPVHLVEWAILNVVQEVDGAFPDNIFDSPETLVIGANEGGLSGPFDGQIHEVGIIPGLDMTATPTVRCNPRDAGRLLVAGDSFVSSDGATYTLAGNAAIHNSGKSELKSNGSASSRTAVAQTFTAPMTLVVVGGFDALTGVAQWLVADRVDTATSIRVGINAAGNFVLDAGSELSVGAADTDPHVFMVRLNIDGTTTFTVSDIGSVTGDAGVTGYDFGTIMANASGTESATGSHARLIIFNDEMSDYSMALIESEIKRLHKL